MGLILAYTGGELYKMIVRVEKDYTNIEYSYDLEEIGEISASNYNGSFDFALGIANKGYEFDIMDNKYVKLEANKVTTDWDLQRNNDTTIRKCNLQELEYIFG